MRLLTSVGGPDQGVHKLEHVVLGLAGPEGEQPRRGEAQVDPREQEDEAAAEEGDGQDAAPARDAPEVHRGRHGGRAAGLSGTAMSWNLCCVLVDFVHCALIADPAPAWHG